LKEEQLVRFLGTALVAVCLITAEFGIAEAQTHGTSLSLSSRDTISAVGPSDPQMLDRSALPSSDAAPAFDRATQEASATVEPATDVMMPVAGSDLKMWSPQNAKSAGPIRNFARGIMRRTSSIAMSLTRSAMRFIGTPYVFGGTSPTSGFDCSAYVQHVFAMVGIQLPRTADLQYYAGSRPVGGIQRGDLVFFQTYEPGPSHVGIYLGSGKFVHASSSHGVTVSRLSDSYWAARYLGAKRFAR
jgi:cell wall-associated NlpC family hydrolase